MRKRSAVQKRAVAWVILALAMGAQPTFALAQPSTPSASDKETARALAEEGDRKTSSGDHGGALVVYQGAHRIMGVPTTGIRVATSLEKLGQLVEARDMAQQVMHIPVTPNEPDVFKEARNEAKALSERVGPKIATLKITASGPPTAATKITVDGTAVASDVAALPRKVNPGKHTIIVAADGYATVTKEITLANGATSDVAIALTPSKGEASSKSTSDSSSPEERVHRGWYVRPSLLLGYVSRSETIKTPNLPTQDESRGGGALMLDVAVGYAPVLGLAVGGELMVTGTKKPSLTINGADAGSPSGTLTSTWLSLFFDWHPKPALGWHIGGSAGFVTSSFDNGGNLAKSQGGLGLGLKGGYDLWVADKWSVGFLGGANLGIIGKQSGGSESSGTLLALFAGVGGLFY